MPRSERLYLLLCGLFLGGLVVTNLIAGKFFTFFGTTLSCGVIAYPVTFLATDLISEVWGKTRANALVLVGFAVSIFVVVIVMIAGAAPIDPASPVSQDTFSKVFTFAPAIVLASMTAYLAAQLVDIRIFHALKRATGGRHLWLRNNGSTVLSQLVDTAVVVVMAFNVVPRFLPSAQQLPLSDLGGMILGGWIFKMLVALADTPLFYLGTRWLRAATEETT